MAAVIKMTEQTLDSRVARLESDVSFIRTDVADIKAGLVQMRDRMDDGFKEVRGEIAGLRSEMHAEITGLRSETHAGFGAVRAEITGLRSEMRAEITGLRAQSERQFRWLVGLMIMIALSFFTAIAAVAHWPQSARNPHRGPGASISQPHRSAIRQIP